MNTHRRITAPRLLSLATALPPHRLSQPDVAEAAAGVFAGEDSPYARLRPVYANAGIESRCAVLPVEDLARPRGWKRWHEIFRPAALELLERAALLALERAGLEPRQVDVLAVACSTGFAVPSLDALLLDRLDFRRDVERLPLVGYGCAGGVLGLARAAAMARAQPGARVLFLTVEICTLTFRAADRSATNIVASALFGDGAAAAVLCADSGEGPRLTGWGEHCWPDSEWVMGWSVEDDGLGVQLAAGLPELLRRDLRGLVDAFLTSQGLLQQDVDHWALHPGGAKVLSAVADSLALSEAALAPAREILRRYGNMSAPTVLFVLEALLAAGSRGRLLCAAFGPGFSAGFLMLEAEQP